MRGIYYWYDMELRIDRSLLAPTVTSDWPEGERPRMGTTTAPYLASELPEYIAVTRITSSLDDGDRSGASHSTTL
jgi:hypothetical protein